MQRLAEQAETMKMAGWSYNFSRLKGEGRKNHDQIESYSKNVRNFLDFIDFTARRKESISLFKWPIKK